MNSPRSTPRLKVLLEQVLEQSGLDSEDRSKAGLTPQALESLLSGMDTDLGKAETAGLARIEREFSLPPGELLDAADATSTANLVRLGAAIRARRDEMRLSVRELAKSADVSPSYITVLEQGVNPKTGVPSKPTEGVVRRIARVLRTPASDFLDLAGHGVDRNLSSDSTVEPFAVSIQRQSLPRVLLELIEMERDYSTYIDAHALAQTPTLILLKALEERSDLRIIGITFGTDAKPSRLVATARPDNDQPDNPGFWEGHKVSVLGKYMGANALLLDSLHRIGFNLQLDDFSAVGVPASGEPSTLIDFVYGVETQLELLQRNAHDLAIIPNHPYVDRLIRLLNLELIDIPFDPWDAFRQADLPLNVVVTTEDHLRSPEKRQEVIAELENIRSQNRAVKQTQRDSVRTAILSESAPVSVPVDLDNEVFIRDIPLATSTISMVSAIGNRAGLTGFFSSDEIERFVVPQDALLAASSSETEV